MSNPFLIKGSKESADTGAGSNPFLISREESTPVVQEQTTPAPEQQPEQGAVPFQAMSLQGTHAQTGRPNVATWGTPHSTMAFTDPNQSINAQQLQALMTEQQNEEIMAVWKKRQFHSYNEMEKRGLTPYDLPGWDQIDQKELEASDKQGAWVLQQLQLGMPMQVIQQELVGLQEPMYGPDDLIADAVTGFSYSGYRFAAKQGLKTAAKVAAKGTAVDVGFGAIAGGAMTAADMMSDSALTTMVAGLLSPAGAKVFFSLSRNSLKQWLKSFAKNNPLEAEKLADAINKTEVKTEGAKEVKKTVKETVDENLKKAVDKAKQGKPETPKGTSKGKGKTPKEKLKDLGTGKLKPAHKVKKPKAKKPETQKSLDDQIKETEAKEKAAKLEDEPLRKDLDARAGKNVKVDSVLRKARHGKEGASVTITDPKSPAKGATFEVEGDPKKLTTEQIQDKVAQKEAEFEKAKVSDKQKLDVSKAKKKGTKSFSGKEVKGALKEAEVKKPKTIKETEMSGDDFLNLTTGSDVRKNAIKEKVKEGKMEGETKGQAPILVVDKDGKVIAHDGRHRAAAAAEKGEKLKTLVVSEDDFAGGALSSQKFGTKDRKFRVELPEAPKGPAPDLRAGIVGGGTLPKPATETKPRPWSKLDRVAVINRKTGEVVESDKKLPFKPSERKNVGKLEEEIRKLRAKMIKRGVSPEDIENGFIANDNLKFVPRNVQVEKIDVKAAVENSVKLRQDAIDTYLKKESKKIATKEAKLKKMAEPKAVHRLVAKDTKNLVEAATKSWWKANPELRKGLDLNELIQASHDAAWQHIRLTPMADLKKYMQGNKQIKAQITGKINNVAKWMSRDYSKELTRQRASLASINAVKRALDEGTLQTPLSLQEGKVGARTDLSNQQVDDLVAGIQDPEIRKAAELGVSMEDLTEGMERAGKASVPANLGRDYKIMMRRTVLPKAGKASALGKKEISKRARKKARRRAFKRKLQAQAEGRLKDVSAEQRLKDQERIKKAEKAAKAARMASDQAKADLRQQGELIADLKSKKQRPQVAAKFTAEQLAIDMEKARKKAKEQAWNLARREKEVAEAKARAKETGEPIKTRAGFEDASDAIGAMKRIDAEKTSDELTTAISKLGKTGGHFLDMQALGDVRRAAQKVGNDALVKEVESIMLREADRIHIRTVAKRTKSIGGTELMSGLPVHKIKPVLLDPIFDRWTRNVDKLGLKVSKYVNTKIAGYPRIEAAIAAFAEDYGLSKAFKGIRKDFELISHQWKMVAQSHAKAIQDIDGMFKSATREMNVGDRAAKLRARQVAEGSLTSFVGTKQDAKRIERLKRVIDDKGTSATAKKQAQAELERLLIDEVDGKFDIVQKASRRFERLEKMLQDRGLLKDHQFKRLSRKELADAASKINKYKDRYKQIVKDIAALDEKSPNQLNRIRILTDEAKALDTARIELLTRMQIHYKNSGKNYLRMLYEKINKANERNYKVGARDKLTGRYAIRRDNWQIGFDEKDGHVFVKQQGKPMKGKSAADVDRMVYRGITEESRDAFLYDYFGKVASNKEWARKSKAPGFTKIKGGRDQWGPLAGVYVKTPIYMELMGDFREISSAHKAYLDAWSVWKQGKTVYSPRAQIRNIMSNTVLADIIANISINKSVRRFLPNMRRYRDLYTGKVVDRSTDLGEMLYQFKMNTTLMQTSFAQQEFTDILSKIDFNKVLRVGDNSNAAHKLFAKILDAGKDYPKVAYQAVESIMKLTIFEDYYKRALKEGKTVKEATIIGEKWAQRALFDYSKVPPAIRWARNVYSPFATFMYKALPAIAKETARRPWKMAKYYGMMYLATKWFDSMSGDDPDQIDIERRNLPEDMQRNMLPGMPSHIRMPFKSKDGDSYYFDLSFIIPWGDVSQGMGDLNFGYRAIMPNNPLLNFYADVKANENIFLQKDLVLKHDKDYEKWLKIIGHGASALAPGFADPHQIKKVVEAYQGKRTWTGKSKGVAVAVLDAAFGIKFRQINPMEAKYFKNKDVTEFVNSANLEAMQRYNDIFIKNRDVLSPEKKSKMFNDLMKDWNEDMERARSKAIYLMNKDAEKP
jgi:hypothetical protein